MNAIQFWDDFNFDYKLNEQDLFSDLIAIEGYKQAALNLALPPEWREQLDRLNRVRAVHGTTAIEGNPFSEEEVASQISNRLEARTERQLSREQLQIHNAERGQEWVKQRFLPGSLPATMEDILAMQRLITQNSDAGQNVPGCLRTYSVTVGSEEMGGVHYGAPPERLGKLMEEFISFINSRRFLRHHPVVKALLAHFFLVTIHPLGDGNGRVSRLLEAGILFQSEYNVHGFYGLSNYFYRNEAEYKRLLKISRYGKPFDVTPFIQFGVRGFAEELTGINNFVKNKLNRLVYRQTLLQNYNKRVGPRRRVLNNREYDLLIFLLTETEPRDPFSDAPSREMTVSEILESQYVRSIYRQVTRRTFVRELIRLSQMGFIKFTQGGRSVDSTVELDFGAIARYPVG